MADQPKEIEDFDIEATEGFELVKVDEGVYEAELTKLVKVPNIDVVRNGVQMKVDMLRWTFTTPDGIELPGTSSTKFSQKAKAFGWAQKLLGREIETGETFKPKDLIGKSCQAVVKDKKRERVFNNEKQVTIYSVVTDVMAPKKTPEQAQPTPQQTPDETKKEPKAKKGK